MDCTSTPANKLIQQSQPSYRGFVNTSKFWVRGVWFSRVQTNSSPLYGSLNGQVQSRRTSSLTKIHLVYHHHWRAWTGQHCSTFLSPWTGKPWSNTQIGCHLVLQPPSSCIMLLKPNKHLLHCCALHHDFSFIPPQNPSLHLSITTIDHILGVYNILADIASRKHQTKPFDFLSWFKSLYIST